MSTVPHVELIFVSLKRVIAISIPLVEENPGFVACPPPFTAKGVLLNPRIRSYKNIGRRGLVHQMSRWLTILLTSSAEPGSTEHVDAWEFEEAGCEISSKYSGAA
jgi:hypothetical protein